MKFANYLVQIAGVRMYPMISLLLFFTFFVIVTLWVLRTDKQTVLHMENLPLEQDQNQAEL